MIVDQYAGPAKILILLETVIEWCLGKASNPVADWTPRHADYDKTASTFYIQNQYFAVMKIRCVKKCVMVIDCRDAKPTLLVPRFL